MEPVFCPNIIIEKRSVPTIYLDTCAIIELSRHEKGKCTIEYKNDVGKLFDVLISMMAEKRIFCPCGNQLPEVGLTAQRKPAKDFLFRFTNLDFLHPDCVRSEQLKGGFRAFVNKEENIKIGLDKVYEKDNTGQFKIHVTPVYDVEKANSLRNEKKNIADVLNKMKSQGKIREKLEDQVAAELEADYISFVNNMRNGMSSETEFGWFLEELDRFYRVTGCAGDAEQLEKNIANYGMFLLSPYHDVLPYIWIRARLWAHLMQRPNKIRESDNLDVQWASAYLPYIDYAVTDRDFCKSLKETGLAEQFRVKVYSLDLLKDLIDELSK